MAIISHHYYVTKVCLRLLRKYTNEIYPNVAPKYAQRKKNVPEKSTNSIDFLGQSSSKNKNLMKYLMANSLECTTSSNIKKTTVENLHLAECVGDVRSLLIEILCDELPLHTLDKGKR